MSMNLIDTDALSSVNYQSHAEPNVYYQRQFIPDTIAHQITSPVTQQNSRNETSEESSDIQLLQSNTSKIIDEQAIIRKQLKKFKLSLVITVTMITVFFVALTMISLAFFASIRDCQTQLLLPDIAEKVTKQVVLLQGNLSVLKNQIDIHSQQLNEYAQQIQTLNEYAQQTQTLNDITEMINNDLAEYAH